MTKNTKLTLKILSIFIFIAITYLAYYLLLQDNYLHASIPSIIGLSHEVSSKNHLLVFSLLPIYIAIIIFGAGTLGLYLIAKIASLFAKLRLRKRP